MLEVEKKRKAKKGMISDDRADFLHKCGKVWRGYVAGKSMVVVTDNEIAPEDLFQEYFSVILIGINKGLVSLKTLSEVTLEDLNEPEKLVEF